MVDIFTKKLFSGSIPPSTNISQFGSLKNGNANYSDDPDTLQALNAWLLGWEEALINGKYPAIQDLNSILYTISRQLAYYQQNGIPEYNENITYFENSIVRDSQARIYKSVTDDNLGNALTDASNWFLMFSPVIYEMTGNYTLTNTDQLIIFLTTDPSAVRYVTLPIPSSIYAGRKITVINKTCSLGLVAIIGSLGSGYTFNSTPSVSGITISSSGITYPKYAHFICDGQDWWCLNNNQNFAL